MDQKRELLFEEWAMREEDIAADPALRAVGRAPLTGGRTWPSPSAEPPLLLLEQLMSDVAIPVMSNSCPAWNLFIFNPGSECIRFI